MTTPTEDQEIEPEVTRLDDEEVEEIFWGGTYVRIPPRRQPPPDDLYMAFVPY